MEVVKLAGSSNEEVAKALREMAEQVEGDPRPVSAWAVTLVYSEGTAGSTYAGPSELALVGALDVTKQRVVEGWDQND